MPGESDLQAFYLHNYKSANGRTRMAIGRAHGTDGIYWENDGMILDVSHPQSTNQTAAALWDNRLTSFPGVWKDGKTWYLVYEGAGENSAYPGDIGLATSTDGTHFVKHPNNPILRHNPIDWEKANIGTPSLYRENGIWYLFYHGFDGKVCQIGVASGTNLTNLVRSAANPILPVSSGNTAWDTGTIGKRSSIMKEGPYYYFAYEVSTAQPYARAKWSSSLARSTNLTSAWTKFSGGQMIPQTSGGMGYDGPELLQLTNTYYLYVRAPHGTKTSRFRLDAKSEGTNAVISN